MTTQQSTTNVNDQQLLSRRPQACSSSIEVFRPPAMADIPELSKENILNMLNQIPDLQGRRFNIEYASSTATEGYPIPSNLDSATNKCLEPEFIDKLPNNIIQHVKSSNNKVLTAALEATIQKEQNAQSTGSSESTTSSLYVQPTTVVHHAAQPYEQVQQSRPVSSDNHCSRSETSSCDTASSSSEETDTDESESAPTADNSKSSFIGQCLPTSYSHKEYR